MSDLSKRIKRIEKDLPGWTWLVRSDEERGAFAHVHRANLVFGDDYIEGQTSFPFYAATAEKALELAHLAAKSHTLRTAFDEAKRSLEAEFEAHQ